MTNIDTKPGVDVAAMRKALEESEAALDAALGQVEHNVIPDWDYLRAVRTLVIEALSSPADAGGAREAPAPRRLIPCPACLGHGVIPRQPGANLSTVPPTGVNADGTCEFCDGLGEVPDKSERLAPTAPVASGEVVGWAVKDSDGIKIKTVSDTRRAAIINWLCTECEVLITQHTSDATIERNWETWRGGAGAEVIEVRTRAALSAANLVAPGGVDLEISDAAQEEDRQ